MRWSPSLFRWHRWFGYLVSLQVLAWVVGGLLFSWLPFDAWVKGGDMLVKPRQSWPSNWAAILTSLPTDKGELFGVHSIATASGPALKLQYAAGDVLMSASGGLLPTPEARQIGDFAQKLYKGTGQLVSVIRVDETPVRLGMVRELGNRRDVWLAQFDDNLRSRFYFDGTSGEFLTVRTEAWVLYDFFWRLHVMDYRDGEDFNNKLLKFASVAAILLAGSGIALSTLALRRAWRKRTASRNPTRPPN
jgi:hypothetical protein